MGCIFEQLSNIIVSDVPIWHSESAVNVNFVPQYIEPKAGAADFRRVVYNNTAYWQLSLTVILNNIDQAALQQVFLLVRERCDYFYLGV